MSNSIVPAWVLILAAGIIVVAFFCWLAYLAIGRDSKQAQHKSGEHHWLTAGRYGMAHVATTSVTGPALSPAVTASPQPTAPVSPSGPVTRQHAIEVHPVHQYADLAWASVTTPMQRQLLWTEHPAGDTTSWTKQDMDILSIRLNGDRKRAEFAGKMAELAAATERRFARIPVGIGATTPKAWVAYHASGSETRWAS